MLARKGVPVDVAASAIGSMRERAHELGGPVEVLGLEHGTVVIARLPLRAEVTT